MDLYDSKLYVVVLSTPFFFLSLWQTIRYSRKISELEKEEGTDQKQLKHQQTLMKLWSALTLVFGIITATAATIWVEMD